MPPGVEVGIDPGSKHTGIAVFRDHDGERHGLFAIQLDHRGGRIRDRLDARAAYRRRRRSANLRYRAPRFSNRTRPKGWLPPSLQHRVDTTRSWVARLRRWAPVRAIHLERVAFDTHLQNPEISGVEYQRGTLYGYEIREYLLAKWDRTCAYCDKTDTPLNLDHVHPQGHGGSDRASNLTLACVPCNQAKGSRPVQAFLAHDPERLQRILTQAKAPLHDAAALNATRWALWRALTATGLPVQAATGGRTKWNRSRTGSPKSHTLDALHVGVLDRVTGWPGQVLLAAYVGRGSHQRTTPDRYGFPRLTRPRVKSVHGFVTGDLVRAVVPSGKRMGVHVGRVLVRGSGWFDITTGHGRAAGVHHRYVRLLQRVDGYGYTLQEEAQSCVAPADSSPA
jgi:5-methylcytosine-specific restriction endonuclease McrA